MPASIGETSSWTPMTPVEATTTSSALDRQPLGDELGHAPGRRDAGLAVAGVRVAGVDDDRLRVAVGEVLARDDEGLADNLVRV